MKTKSADPLDPWDRRPGETPKAYAMFIEYRDQGRFGHSLRQLAAREGSTKLAQLGLWSRTHDWVDRVGAYDDYLDRQAQVEQVEQVKAMRRRHAALGYQLHDIAAERIRAINIEKLTVREALLIAELAIKIERQARGEVTDIQESRTESEADGPTGADILTALRTSPTLMNLADELDRIMIDGADE